MQLDRTLERLSRIVFILACLALIAVAVLRVRQELAPRARLTPAVSSVDGAVIANPEGVSYAAARATLMIAVRSTCRFCAESLPFYKRLSALRQTGHLQLVVLSTESKAATAQFIAQADVHADAVVQDENGLIPVKGTPMLLLVTGDGTVIKSWLGRLDARQETEVINAIQNASGRTP